MQTMGGKITEEMESAIAETLCDNDEVTSTGLKRMLLSWHAFALLVSAEVRACYAGTLTDTREYFALVQ